MVLNDKSLFMHLWTVAVLKTGGFLSRHWFLQLVHGNGNPRCWAGLGSNPRTLLRTIVDLQEKTAPNKSLRTVGVTGSAP